MSNDCARLAKPTAGRGAVLGMASTPADQSARGYLRHAQAVTWSELDGLRKAAAPSALNPSRDNCLASCELCSPLNGGAPAGFSRMRPPLVLKFGPVPRSARTSRSRPSLLQLRTCLRINRRIPSRSSVPTMPAGRPARLLKGLFEYPDADLRVRIALGKRKQHADPPHPVGMLRTRRERPRGSRAAEQLDELSPLHCVPMPRVRRGLVRSLDRALRVSRKGHSASSHSLLLVGFCFCANAFPHIGRWRLRSE
jgi:hypothetical protein